ncbi:metal-dependent hydrolase [Nocardiopsis coralliicola]
MMGSSHAATGALAGVLLAAAADAGPVGLLAAAGVGAGAALVPDLDHPASTASRSQGPLSRGACTAVRRASRAAWRATRTPRDDGGQYDERGAHRHLTHTVPAAMAVGAGAGAAALHWTTAAVALWLLLSLGLRGLGASLTGRDRASLSQWTTVSLGAALATAVVLAVEPPHPLLLGAVAAAGMVVHTLGDWLTRAGVPLAWPLRVRGKRWWMWRSPLPFAADAEGWQERVVRATCWICVPITAAWCILG